MEKGSRAFKFSHSSRCGFRFWWWWQSWVIKVVGAKLSFRCLRDQSQMHWSNSWVYIFVAQYLPEANHLRANDNTSSSTAAAKKWVLSSVVSVRDESIKPQQPRLEFRQQNYLLIETNLDDDLLLKFNYTLDIRRWTQLAMSLDGGEEDEEYKVAHNIYYIRCPWIT